MLKVIVPMAGTSALFPEAEFFYPKPLIEINGKPSVEYVLENISHIEEPVHYLFVVRDEDCKRFHLDNLLRLLIDNCTVVPLKKDTQGALCSVLMAIDYINADDELLILNSDQIIDCNFAELLAHFRSCQADAGLLVFESVHPRWSYARLDENQVIETAEKNPISKNAMAGFYYFKKAGDFFRNAFVTLEKQNCYNNLYYLSPVINQFVLEGKSTVARHIRTDQYVSFYSPRKLKEFEEHLVMQGRRQSALERRMNQ